MIKLVKSTFYNELETKKKLCDFLMNAEQLSMGKKCLEFESKFSEYQKRKYSVFLNSGSSANLALIQSLLNLGKLRAGDNVGFSALTWSTNVMPLLQLNLNPVPIDVSLGNLNVCSDKLSEILKKTKLKALFITNLLGFCGDLDKISKICEEDGIILLEDNCESFGSELNNVRLGNFGIASTTSFYVGHHMSTIEGGLVCTDDEELYDMLLMVRAHGWDRNLSSNKKNLLRKKYKIDDFYSRYTFYVPGYNLRPTEINAVLGLEQLNYAKKINKIRNENFKLFDKAAKSNSNLRKLKLDHMSFISNFAYPVVCKNAKVFVTYKNKFESHNVEIRPIVGGSMVEQPFFMNYVKKKKLQYSCPNARKIHQFGFYVPNNPELTKEEKELICNSIK